MTKMKKMMLAAASLGSLVTPVVAVVSCGKEAAKNTGHSTTPAKHVKTKAELATEVKKDLEEVASSIMNTFANDLGVDTAHAEILSTTIEANGDATIEMLADDKQSHAARGRRSSSKGSTTHNRKRAAPEKHQTHVTVIVKKEGKVEVQKEHHAVPASIVAKINESPIVKQTVAKVQEVVQEAKEAKVEVKALSEAVKAAPVVHHALPPVPELVKAPEAPQPSTNQGQGNGNGPIAFESGNAHTNTQLANNFPVPSPEMQLTPGEIITGGWTVGGTEVFSRPVITPQPDAQAMPVIVPHVETQLMPGEIIQGPWIPYRGEEVISHPHLGGNYQIVAGIPGAVPIPEFKSLESAPRPHINTAALNIELQQIVDKTNKLVELKKQISDVHTISMVDRILSESTIIQTDLNKYSLRGLQQFNRGLNNAITAIIRNIEEIKAQHVAYLASAFVGTHPAIATPQLDQRIIARKAELIRLQTLSAQQAQAEIAARESENKAYEEALRAQVLANGIQEVYEESVKANEALDTQITKELRAKAAKEDAELKAKSAEEAKTKADEQSKLWFELSEKFALEEGKLAELANRQLDYEIQAQKEIALRAAQDKAYEEALRAQVLANRIQEVYEESVKANEALDTQITKELRAKAAKEDAELKEKQAVQAQAEVEEQESLLAKAYEGILAQQAKVIAEESSNRETQEDALSILRIREENQAMIDNQAAQELDNLATAMAEKAEEKAEHDRLIAIIHNKLAEELSQIAEQKNDELTVQHDQIMNLIHVINRNVNAYKNYLMNIGHELNGVVEDAQKVQDDFKQSTFATSIRTLYRALVAEKNKLANLYEHGKYEDGLDLRNSINGLISSMRTLVPLLQHSIQEYKRVCVSINNMHTHVNEAQTVYNPDVDATPKNVYEEMRAYYKEMSDRAQTPPTQVPTIEQKHDQAFRSLQIQSLINKELREVYNANIVDAGNYISNLASNVPHLGDSSHIASSTGLYNKAKESVLNLLKADGDIINVYTWAGHLALTLDKKEFMYDKDTTKLHKVIDKLFTMKVAQFASRGIEMFAQDISSSDPFKKSIYGSTDHPDVDAYNTFLGLVDKTINGGNNHLYDPSITNHNLSNSDLKNELFRQIDEIAASDNVDVNAKIDHFIGFLQERYDLIVSILNKNNHKDFIDNVNKALNGIQDVQ